MKNKVITFLFGRFQQAVNTFLFCVLLKCSGFAEDTLVRYNPHYQQNIDQVCKIPCLVALWDFTKRESEHDKRFAAHVPKGAHTDYPLDVANYVKDYWGKGRDATYADFPLIMSGPFGQAIQIKNEKDHDFRPFLFIPRARLHDTPLDIKGANKSVSIVVWAIRESGNHALAGIWHEGTDLKQKQSEGIKKVERGQRQYALFAGLEKHGSACGHVSENGGGSFAHKYAWHKCYSIDISPLVPSSSTIEILDNSWECFAMTFDSNKQEITAWLNGKSGDVWQEDVKTKAPPIYRAWLQGKIGITPGVSGTKDHSFPTDQYYNPPEDNPVSVKIISQSEHERVELQEFQFTRLKVIYHKNEKGDFTIFSKDLTEVRLNPWWFPHSIYSPTPSEGGPFSIGRVIHSGRGVGFTGWIGGVAVFEKALTSEELKKLSDLNFH